MRQGRNMYYNVLLILTLFSQMFYTVKLNFLPWILLIQQPEDKK